MALQNKRFVFVVLFILLFVNFIAWAAVYDLSRPKFLEVIFFDVGQGDGALIKTAEGHYILVDGGESSKMLEKLLAEIPFWKREIDLVILSHPHYDHFGGLIDIIERYQVKNILWNGVAEDSLAFERWQESVSKSDANIIISLAGQKIKGENFFIDILYPFINLEGIEFKDANLSSIYLRLVFQKTSFLFTGDGYKSNENELVQKEIFCQENNHYLCRVMFLDSDVLKVGHHGSKTSTSEEFVSAVLPEIAVISAGKNNRYGHPHKETLDLLERYDINILRTDLNGDIKIISDGKSLIFSTD